MGLVRVRQGSVAGNGEDGEDGEDGELDDEGEEEGEKEADRGGGGVGEDVRVLRLRASELPGLGAVVG
ncbi:hypothetical protein GCM10022224_066260 [Nonomuraea antimicrobica]|uniref:Uncharacterized protein n=2 Tax=Nonomuraea antimicrobica TaxID=561173 RepID=A0ABP7CN10_9ACTN